MTLTEILKIGQAPNPLNNTTIAGGSDDRRRQSHRHRGNCGIGAKPMRLAALILLASPIWAATYYVDFAGGSNAANGTATSTPWKHAPGMQGCTGTCASTTPAAGDRFIFKGGVTWDHTCFQMSIAWSGTTGNPIYFGVDKTWFTGGAWTRPIFNGDHTTLASGSNLISVSSQNYITIDDIELKGHRSYSNWGIGSIGHGCSTYLVMQNLYVHDWSLDTSVTTDDAHGGIIGNYPSCRPTGTKITNSVISNAEARDAGRQNGVAVRSTDVEHSVIHDVQTAQLFGLMNNSEVYNVGWPATGRGVAGSNQGFDVTYHDNTTYVESWDGGGMSYIRPGLIYNNVFHDIATGSGGIYLNGCPSTNHYVFNNLIYNFHANAAVLIDQYPASSTCGEFYIWNNTFQVPSDHYTGIIAQADRGFTLGLLDTRNNHYITESGITWVRATPTVRVDSNNLTQTNAQATTAGYVAATAYFPPSGGATIGAGANLSSLGITALNSDKNGVARGSSWDIGAFEYAAPPPPTTLRGTMRGATIK